MIQPRKIVQDLHPYAPPEEGRHGFIRLDFNENTVGFPEAYPVGLPAPWVVAYPEYQEFIEKLAAYFNLTPDSILLTNGSDEGLGIIPATFIEPGVDKAITAKPTFSMIPHYMQLAGACLSEIPMKSDLTYDLDAIDAALASGVKLAVFASPDNPTGALLPSDQVAQWCEQYPNTLFTIDEAYAEYTPQSVVPLLSQYANLLVTRTFSKAWGMAGLRLGVVLGNPALIASLYRVRSPYSVNTSAVWTANQLLDQAAAVMQEACQTMSRKESLMEVVRAMGYRVIPGHANFFLLSVGLDAQKLCEFARERGILLRNRSAQLAPCPDSLWGLVRVTVGTAAENQRFVDTLESFRDQHALMFDMDDTLVDTSKSFDVTVDTLVEKHSGKPLAPGELQALRAEGGYNDDWDSTVALLQRRGVTVPREQIAVEGSEIYLSLAAENETLMIEPELLKELSRRYRLFVVTGRMRPEYDPVWATRMDGFFERVYCRDDLNGHRPKPAPDPLLAVLEKHSLKGGFYVGNSVDDMKAAVGASLIPVGVTTTQTESVLCEAGARCILTNTNDIRKAFLL